jgi:hypothetical protein
MQLFLISIINTELCCYSLLHLSSLIYPYMNNTFSNLLPLLSYKYFNYFCDTFKVLYNIFNFISFVPFFIRLNIYKNGKAMKFNICILWVN